MADSTTLNIEREEINLGAWTQKGFEGMIAKAAQIGLEAKKIDFISRQFLGMYYREGTLIGGDKTAERFVVDLSGVDCFTFLDYVESLRQSCSFSAFKSNLACVRYRSGIVAFDHRNHFFSDWIGANREFIEDVTKQVGGCHARSSRKMLNTKEDGTFYLSGIDPAERIIDYIPSDAIDKAILRKCKTGDYIGIYADVPGLDVSHVGIFIRKKSAIYLRHASSLPECRMVIDQEFTGYMAGKPGFLVLRPRERT